MRITSNELEVELSHDEIAGGEILIGGDGAKLILKDGGLETLLTITFEDLEELRSLFRWFMNEIPSREDYDPTCKSIAHGVKGLENAEIEKL